MRASLGTGANFWNGGDFYGTPERNSLHLLNEYFTKYPEDAEKVVLSIKGGIVPGEMRMNCSPENVRRSVDECIRLLDGRKSVDIFECARVDPNIPIEETIRSLAELVKEGKINGIGLSETSAETIRRAHKVHPIAAVEVELSLWATDILWNGIATTCGELGIPIVAYSPLAKGALTGLINTIADIPEGDPRKHLPKFQDDVMAANMRVTHEVEKLAEKKGVTKAQVAIGWVKALSGRNGMPTIIPIPGAITVERVLENGRDVVLTQDEMEEIEGILKNNEVKGARYGGPVAALSEY
jgi:pyridoxine 4-dehydrogenase